MHNEGPGVTLASLKSERNKAVKLLNWLCNYLEKGEERSYEASSQELFARAKNKNAELASYWWNHQIEERVKQAEEAAKKEKIELRDKVLAKLTYEERKILGF